MPEPLYSFNLYGRWIDDVFYTTDVHGMGSVLTTTLTALKISNKEAKKINAKFSFLPYKDIEDEDIWNLLFQDPNPKIVTDQNIDFFDHWLVTKDFCTVLETNMILLKPWIQKYFTPNENIIQIVNNYIEKYNIDLENTIVVHYRSTIDKYGDCIKDTSSAEYVKSKLLDIVEQNPSMRVLVQSDYIKYTEYFMEVCKQNYPFYIKELPQSKNGEGVHVATRYNFRIKYGMEYLASLILISKCKHIVTHYGHGGLWTCLFRGNVDNVLVL